MPERWLIVGAGSAGCVLANRLSADGTRHVTLVDDGPGLSPQSVPDAIGGPNFFAAMAEPGRMHEDLVASRTTGGEHTLYQRGRGIGGSSVVNAMVALRGSDELYRSWGWHDVGEAWERIALATEPAATSELGAVDRALLAADERAEHALLTRSSGRRVTSAEAYLWPALDRGNLTVRAGAAVNKIVLQGTRATGVLLDDGNEIDADRIVLSAGAIHSPVLLLRSGIETAGIGDGLQDHPSAVFTLALKPDVAQDVAGLAIGSHMHADIDDDIIQLLPMSTVGVTADAAGFGALLVALMTPTSRSGTVRIDSQGDPVVDFALLDTDHDIAALTAGVRVALDVLQRQSFAEIVEQVYIDDAGTPAASLTSDDVITGWLRQRCGDYVHASSTCAQGRVVDETGAVIGYENLYVCDASVFPSIPDANTHLPTTMLAERLSAMYCT